MGEMRTILVATVLALAACTIFGGCSKTSNESESEIVENACMLDTPTIVENRGGTMLGNAKTGENVGNVPVGKTFSHSAVIQNNGESELYIDSIVASNSDTRAKASRDSLSPTMLIAITSFVTPVDEGEFERDVKIYFRNAKKPLDIRIAGTATKE